MDSQKPDKSIWFILTDKHTLILSEQMSDYSHFYSASEQNSHCC